MTEQEMRDELAQVIAKRNRRAGFRALENKYGHRAARDIVRKHNGR